MVKPNIAPKTQTAGFMIFTSLMLLILTSVLLALFLNRLKIAEASETAPTRRIQDLVTLLKQAEEKRTSLESEVTKLRTQLVSLEKSKPANRNSDAMSPELKKLYKLAGLTPVTDEGIVIKLQDSKKSPSAKDPHTDPNAGKLQADDILKLVNDLKAAGATAISINDQRLIATSEIVTAGPSISVNQTRLTQPVVVKATGDPDVLIGALKIRGGILEYLNFFDIDVTLDKSKAVEIPAYQGPLAS